MNVLSLYTGIGGIDLGLQQAGLTITAQVEQDPYCLETLTTHWPEVPRHDNVKTLEPWWNSHPRPPIHLLAAGFPCQPFSLAGWELGDQDHRWGWPATLDAIRLVQPPYVLLENVATLLNHQRAFGTILGDLAHHGFDAVWDVLRASDFGAPHARPRLFLLAYPPTPSRQNQSRTPRTTENQRRRELGRSGLQPHQRTRWLPEPQVDRVAHGVPSRLVRRPLETLGNAVVPAITRHLGELIMRDHHAA